MVPLFCMWCYDLNLVTTIMIIYGVELCMNCCRNRESDSSYEDQKKFFHVDKSSIRKRKGKTAKIEGTKI